MIHFKYVRWQNFLSTGNQFTEIQLDRNNTTLIIGENGAGKSTILDALCFGLFGKPFRNINKPQLLNSVNGSACEVEVEFRIGTKEVKVVRGIKPNKFEIYINGKMYNQDANSRDYQKYLEQQILKLNYRSFTQVVILGSSTFVPFMQLKARHRREVVEEILDIQIFSLMNMLLKQKLKTIDDDLKDVDYKIALSSEKIELKEKYIENIKENKRKLLTEKKSSITKNEKEIGKKSQIIDSLKKKNALSSLSISDSTKIKEKFDKLKDIQSTLREKHRAHSKLVTFFEDNTDCPTCQQHIDEEFKSDMLDKKRADADKVSLGLNELKEEIDSTKIKMDEINVVLDNIQKNSVEIAKENSSITQLEKFNSTLQTEIEHLETGHIEKADYRDLEKLKEELQVFADRKSKLREDKTYAEASKNMLQDTGIKTKIIKQYLPVMNRLINTYLTSMEFYVNFTLDESFEETIKSRYRDDFSYSSFRYWTRYLIVLWIILAQTSS